MQVFSRHSSPLALVILLLIGGTSCLRRSDNSGVTDRTDDWADADIRLLSPSEPYRLMIQYYPPVDKSDTRIRYNLFAVKESEGPEGERKQVYYSDWSDASRQSVRSYTYKLEIELRIPRIDIFFVLAKDTPSQAQSPKASFTQVGPRRLYIGGGNLAGTQALITPVSGAPFALAVAAGSSDFVGNGQIAVNFMQNAKYEYSTLNQCLGDETKGCQIIPLESVCAGKIEDPKCRPATLPTNEAQVFSQAGGEVLGATPLSNGSYLLKSGIKTEARSAELIFVATSQASTNQSNQELCLSQVSILKASAHDLHENAACKVRAESSASAKNGKLACHFIVSFDRPLDVAEHACNITAIFRGNRSEYQSVQILYQKESIND